MADLASTRVFGKLTVMHEAIVKANAEITGNITASKFIGDGSQLTALPWGEVTGAPATATRWPAWGEVTGKPAQATRWPAWGEVTGKPSTFAPSAHTHSLAQITDAGNLAAINTNASTSNFLRGDGTWATPPNTNTTYAEITTAEIDAGTASTLRTITGRRMKYALDKKSDTGHSHVIGDVTGLQAALDSKANTSTQVIAGTGLSGGGTLAANRTLSVTYGTAAGTAAQGNDSRLSDSREWTASVVSQAEAEAGTATTARKWTAQRVRQAIVAWFNGVSGALGRTILTRTTADQVRSDIGLTDAATTTVAAIRAGNAASATKLATARTINGVSFDGSENITLPTTDGTPAGAVMAFARNTPPDGWLKANGAAVSRTTYASLFAAIGTTFGAGNGSSTFNLPDMRGEFLRGWDEGRGADSGRTFGSTQGGQNASHTHTASTNSTGAHTHSISGTAASAGAHTHALNLRTGDASWANGSSNVVTTAGNTRTSASGGAHTHSVSGTAASAGAHSHTVTVNSSGGNEARPRNIAILYCIKY